MLCLVLCQGSVAPQVPCLMDRETTAATLLGAQSPTPVTQGTGWLQVVLLEHVSQIVSGQGVIQHVHVSAQYCALPLQQHTDAVIPYIIHGHFKPQATVVLLALFLWTEGEVSLGIPKGTQSLTPATQDTVSPESVPGDVSPTAYGLEISLHVQVSV